MEMHVITRFLELSLPDFRTVITRLDRVIFVGVGIIGSDPIMTQSEPDNDTLTLLVQQGLYFTKARDSSALMD